MGEKLKNLIEEGLGEYKHFRDEKGRMLRGKKIGEKVFRRENDMIPINFSEGAPENTEGCHIRKIEKTREGARYYIVDYYAKLKGVRFSI